MKIEPMSVDRIKHLVAIRKNWTEPHDDFAALIFAWAHERARANAFANLGNRDRHERFQEVLDEIGWPKGQR